jgi:hypothetical protein
MKLAGVVVVVVGSACSFTPGVLSSDALVGSSDMRSDADETLGWSTPVEITELSSPDGADDPSLTADLTEIYFGSHRTGSMGGIEEDIWMAKRSSASQPFGTPTNVAELNTTSVETTPKVTPDGLKIFFASTRGGGLTDIWVSTRASRSVVWGPPGKIAEISTANPDYGAAATDTLLHLVYCSGAAPAEEKLFVSNRANTLALWGAPVAIGELDEASVGECDPHEPNAFAIYYVTPYLSAGGTYDIYRAARPTEGDNYGSRTAVSAVNLPGFNDRDPWVSADEQTMVFSSDRGGVTFQLYQSTR